MKGTQIRNEVLLAIGQMAAVTLLVAVVYGLAWYVTRITPEREAALKAEGAAAFDAKVEAAGGWQKWLAAELAEVRR